jgi:hypothetical protein
MTQCIMGWYGRHTVFHIVVPVVEWQKKEGGSPGPMPPALEIPAKPNVISAGNPNGIPG